MIISIIIPCRNEAKHITACVEAIFASALPEGCTLEVVVVDGESDDGTRDVIAGLQERFPQLRLLPNPQRITPVAFNLGIQATSGDYVQIIGARQFVAPDYLARGIQRLQQQPEIWCVGGKVENSFADETSRIIARAMDTPFGVGGGNFRILTTSAFVDTVGTPMYPRFVFERIGLFDEALIRNQDDEFNFRITKAGGRIFLDVEMRVAYVVRGVIANLYRQYFQYGYWKVYVNRKHGTITTLRQLAPAAFLLFALLGWCSIFLSVYAFAVYAGVLVLYGLLALLYAVKKAEQPKQIPTYLRTFFALHAGYGLGYLQGIWQFLVLRRKAGTSHQAALSR